MKGIYYDLKLSKVVRKKIGLARKFSMIKYRDDWPEPEIKFPRQVKIRTIMSGICASDLHQINVRLPYAASILARKENPFQMGHEVIGTVTEIGSEVMNLKVGDRVVFSPITNCEAFGFEECSSCREGDYQTCLSLVGVGDGSNLEDEYGGRGKFGGFAGGGFSERFIAFEGQLSKVPEGLPSELAVLAEPFCVSLHAVLKSFPNDDETVVVIGAGIIGLMMIAGIRTLGSKCKIITLARYPAQIRAAEIFGADVVVTERDQEELYEKIASLTGGMLFKPALGSKILYGNTGPDIIFDSVGTGPTIDDAFHLVRTNGKIVIVGVPYEKLKKVSWSLQVYKELDVSGSMMHGREEIHSEKMDTIELAVKLLNENQSLFQNLVTHRFPISEYKEALKIASNKGKYNAIKVAFDYSIL